MRSPQHRFGSSADTCEASAVRIPISRKTEPMSWIRQRSTTMNHGAAHTHSIGNAASYASEFVVTHFIDKRHVRPYGG